MATIKTLDNSKYDHGFKVGSYWPFTFTRKIQNPITLEWSVVDITGMTGRVIYRLSSVDGSIIHTVSSGSITVTGTEGKSEWGLMPAVTVLFTPNLWAYFDLELTPADGKVWQSGTMRFKPVQEVTR